MIEAVEFFNFKALRTATLPLGPFTLIVGPNGSGKTTALQALRLMTRPDGITYERALSGGIVPGPRSACAVAVRWAGPKYAGWASIQKWVPNFNPGSPVAHVENGARIDRDALWQAALSEAESHLLDDVRRPLLAYLQGIRVYSLEASDLAEPTMVGRDLEIEASGRGLPAVIDQLRDRAPERFKALEEEVCRMIPEFDSILFETPGKGMKAIALRSRHGRFRVPAADLSQGTLLALGLLSLVHHDARPTMICIEDPDRGIHPRLLRDLRDALYRISHPAAFDERRAPVQVVVTTHSPLFLDLFRDHPDEIVIASKQASEATFQRLSDVPNHEEILEGSSLGDVWYTGVLGGVPPA